MSTATDDLMVSLGDTSLPEPEESQDRWHDEDRAPLVMGHDGDDTGPLTKQKFRIDGNGDEKRLLALLAPTDMMQSGHGFAIRDIGAAPKTTWRTTCELCGTALPLPAADGWVCELDCEPGTREWDTCRCNWCLIRGQWLRGEFRPKGGRPAKRCGTPECKRRAAAERKRRQRDREKAKALLARIDEVPESAREGVRAKLMQRIGA
ncbi:hypothetical protein [Rhodococcus sp. (in: high G+C Gram-positive bacteria)]|uniref:hypothetical protein n=1 Tax=Rhodococcus sp. TaxID=1831 RepID=UPI003B8A82B7